MRMGVWGYRGVGVLALAAVLTSCRTAPPAAPAAQATPLTVERGARRIQIVGDQFYVDGVRLLIKASFYCYHPVGKNPWDVHPTDRVLRAHLRALKAAGFNTIRWFQPNAHEIEICRQEGVYVFQQLWILEDGDYSDPEFRRGNLDRLRQVVRETRGHDNVLGYLVANEPHLHTATTDREIRDTLGHLVEIRDMIRQEDPGAYVSYDDWPSLFSLDHSMWDFIAFNVYTWSPITTTDHGMGYRPFLEHVKRRHAAHRPLVILEYGVSVCPTDITGYGYGGWSEDGQAAESLSMLRDILASGAAGACYTHFADQIWTSGSNATQEAGDPEEWFGMLALDPASGPMMEGRWRPVYFAHQQFYRAVLMEPSAFSTVRGTERVLVHSDDALVAHFRIEEGNWVSMDNEAGPWWVGWLDTTKLRDGPHRIEIITEDGRGEAVSREAWVVIANTRADPYTRRVSLTPPWADIQPGDPLTVTALVQRADGTPVAEAPIHWGVHEHRGWDIEPRSAVTGPDGRAELSVDTRRLLGLATVSAGVDVTNGPYARRFGDLATLRVGMK